MTATATRGAPIGSQNGKKPRIWSDALRKHFVQNPEDLAKAVKALVNRAMDGDVSAGKEIADRLEGRPMQPIEQKTEISGEVAVNTRPQLTKDEWLKAHGLGTSAGPAG